MATAVDHALYSLARDLITGQMSLLSGQLHQQRIEVPCNEPLCDELKAQVSALFFEREDLDSTDPAAVETTIMKYARTEDHGREAMESIRQVVFEE